MNLSHLKQVAKTRLVLRKFLAASQVNMITSLVDAAIAIDLIELRADRKIVRSILSNK